jgi:hypothetical protein
LSGSDSDSLARRFVRGRSVNWFGVARTIVSSFVLAVAAGLITFWEAVLAQPRRLVTGGFDFWRAMLLAPFDAAAEQIRLAWQVAAAQFPLAGPFDYAIGVFLIAFVFWLVAEVGVRLVSGVFAN